MVLDGSPIRRMRPSSRLESAAVGIQTESELNHGLGQGQTVRRLSSNPVPNSGGLPDPIKSAFDHAESPMMKQAPRRPRTVGLDKQCSRCGAPIHHTYVGPVEGVCGRCTDKRRGKRVRTRRVALHGNGPAPKRRSTASAVVLISVVMVGGAAAVVLVLRMLLG